MPRRALVICTHFPPLNATGARRPYYLARALADAGWQVSVLTTDLPVHDRWNADLDGIRVLRLPPTYLQQDLSTLQGLVAWADHRLQGTGAHGPVRVAADLVLPLEHRTRWDIDPQQLDKTLGTQDVVIATGPGWSVADIGRRAARYWNALFNLDYRDPWTVHDPRVAMDIVTGQGRGPAAWLRSWRMRREERKALRSAGLVTTTSTGFLRNVQGIHAVERGLVVHGGYDPSLTLPGTPRNRRFTVTYTGRLYPEQDWDRLFSAVERIQLERPELIEGLLIRFIGPVSTDTSLLQRLKELATRHTCFELMDRCTREEAVAFQHRSDAVIHLTYRDRVGYLPVKFLEYLGAGRPLILVSAEHDEAEIITERTGAGIVVRDTDALVRLLIERTMSHLDGATWRMSTDQGTIDAYAYPRRMRQWVEALESALPGSPEPASSRENT